MIRRTVTFASLMALSAAIGLFLAGHRPLGAFLWIFGVILYALLLHFDPDVVAEPRRRNKEHTK